MKINNLTKLEWRIFQRKHGLKDDGVPGWRTLAEVKRIDEELDSWRLGSLGPSLTVDEYVPVEHYDMYPWARNPKHKQDGTYIYRLPHDLLPAFAIKVDLLFRRMDDAGFDPVLQEARRSFKRAEALNVSGRGIKKSMHCYGAAVDIIDKRKAWGADYDFWLCMRDTAEELGMFVLYYSDGSMQDRAHIQAIPVSEQKMFRAMTDAERAKHVATRA